MNRKLSDEDMSVIIDRYLSGDKMIDIANDFNVRDDTIRSYLKKCGVPSRRKFYAGYTQEECDDILDMYINDQWDNLFSKYPRLTKQNVYSIASKFGGKKESYYWTDEEVSWLMDNYNSATSDEIEERYHPRHNLRAVQTKAQKMGLTQTHFWTSEEDEILKKYYSIKPLDEIYRLLPGRSYNSIVCRGQKLGVVSLNYIQEKYSLEQEQFIIDNFGKLSDQEIADTLNKPLCGIQEKRRRLGLYVFAKDYSGYENVAKLLRGHLQEWKDKSMYACNYQCVLTGSHNFDIHHIYSFNKIFEETMISLEEEGFILSNQINDYTKEELDKIIMRFLGTHNKYPLGVCVRKDIHDLFHRIYGSGGNTYDQWNNFVERFKNGEFEDHNNFRENS